MVDEKFAFLPKQSQRSDIAGEASTTTLSSTAENAPVLIVERYLKEA